METPERATRRHQVLDELRGKPRPHKYRAEKTVYDGIRYDSKAEASRARELDFLIRAGEVRCWIRQPAVYLGCVENLYRPDFLVIPNRDLTINLLERGDAWTPMPWFEEIKGVETSKFKRDKKLWRRYGQLELRVIRGGLLTEVIEPE